MNTTEQFSLRLLSIAIGWRPDKAEATSARVLCSADNIISYDTEAPPSLVM